MLDWGNWIVIGIVAAAVVWCVRWVYRIWKGKAALCACDPGACPVAKKLEKLNKTVDPSQEQDEGSLSAEDSR